MQELERHVGEKLNENLFGTKGLGISERVTSGYPIPGAIEFMVVIGDVQKFFKTSA